MVLTCYKIWNNENHSARVSTLVALITILATKLKVKYLTYDLRQVQNNVTPLIA